jgi:hypothetical protein
MRIIRIYNLICLSWNEGDAGGENKFMGAVFESGRGVSRF